MLLARGANIWCRSDGGGTVLIAAAGNDDADPAMIKLILSELRKRSCSAHPVHVEINRPYRAQTVKMKVLQVLSSALYSCRLRGNPLVVGIATDVGTTALHNAAKRGDREVFKLLLDAGCDPSKRTALGLTAADVALLHGHQPRCPF